MSTKDRKRTTPLQSMVTMSCLKAITNHGTEKLANDIFSDEKDHRKQVHLWTKGTRIRKSNQEQIIKEFPAVAVLIDTPLFSLLETTARKDEEIYDLLSIYKNNKQSSIEYWDISVPQWCNTEYDWPYINFPTPICGRTNSQALAEYGGIDGFIIILGLLHLTKLSATSTDNSSLDDNSLLKYHLIQAARAFPHLARHPAINPYWHEFYALFKNLWDYLLPECDTLILDDKIMTKLIEMETDYCLWRGGYGRYPKSIELITLPAPVLYPKKYESVYV